MAPDPTRPPRSPGQGPGGGEMMGAGFQLVGCILAGLFGGQWLDARLGTAPWLLLLGVFLGFGASFWSIYTRLTPRGGGRR